MTVARHPVTPDGHHVVFFDGLCGLCDRTVKFLLRRDRHDRFRFAALQSAAAESLLRPRGGRPEALDTIYVLSADGRLLTKSRAVFFAVAALGGVWRLVGLLRHIPRPISDAGYDLVARVRYRLFGKFESCVIPSVEERRRFLEATVPEGQTSSI